MTERYAVDDLKAFAAALFERSGLAEDRARSMARVFVEADLLGFTTHGLQRVPINLEWLHAGYTRKRGEPEVLDERQAAFSWDAAFLPGPYVVERAAADAAARARESGIAAATIRRATHVAALAAYLVPVVEAELVGLLVVSTPDERFIAPFGAHEAVYSNNPLAFCAPTSGAPLLFDVSMAVTAGGRIARAEREGRRMPEPCLKDARGRPTDDPGVMGAGGTVMPIGGLGHGHKGFALTLMTEVLTQALSGHGRADAAGEGEANSVFIQVIDPRAFAHWESYLGEVDHLLQVTRRAAPDDPRRPVRVPGERAWEARSRAFEDGVPLYPGVLGALVPWAEKLGVAPPRPLDRPRRNG
ncbi:MAG: Ldh family oxidoreductase [Pseudomonadota bacterium]